MPRPLTCWPALCSTWQRGRAPGSSPRTSRCHLLVVQEQSREAWDTFATQSASDTEVASTILCRRRSAKLKYRLDLRRRAPRSARDKSATRQRAPRTRGKRKAAWGRSPLADAVPAARRRSRRYCAARRGRFVDTILQRCALTPKPSACFSGARKQAPPRRPPSRLRSCPVPWLPPCSAPFGAMQVTVARVGYGGCKTAY